VHIQHPKLNTFDHSSTDHRIKENMRMCSIDIKDMYTNIPKEDVTNIIKNIPDMTLNTISQKEIMGLLGTILEQNYCQFNQKYYRQTEGRAMGAPTSAV
jgi:predicted DNA binding CopG/RHH family protein